MPQVADLIKMRGDAYVLGFPKTGPRSYDEYLALGIQPKRITQELCDELVKEKVLAEYHRACKPRAILGHRLPQLALGGRRIWPFWKYGNLIVNAGLLNVGNLITGNISSYAQLPTPAGWFSNVGVGSSATTPTSGDTDLNAYIGTRVLVSAAFMIGSNVAKWDTYFSPSAAVGTWYECGHFTTSGIGTGAMGSHLLVNPSSGYVKGANSAVLDIQWTL